MSVMLYESKAWCLGQSEIEILQRTQRAIVGALCGMKMVDKKMMKDPMQMLGFEESIDKLAEANSLNYVDMY